MEFKNIKSVCKDLANKINKEVTNKGYSNLTLIHDQQGNLSIVNTELISNYIIASDLKAYKSILKDEEDGTITPEQLEKELFQIKKK